MRRGPVPPPAVRPPTGQGGVRDGGGRGTSLHLRPHTHPAACPLIPVLRESLCAVVGRRAVHNALRVPPEATVEFG
ncbi:hypothetical protein ACRJ4W_13395 [Streptomyces sp. GLT-R25]